MFAWLTSPEAWVALGTLTALEIVLGIDNIIFISVLVGRLPEQKGISLVIPVCCWPWLRVWRFYFPSCG